VTIALDTSALLARYLAGPAQAVVTDALAADRDWCASALALTEALLAADRMDIDAEARDALRGALHDDWPRLHVVPVDSACLDRAAELGREQPLRGVDAVHLAAADRLPRPVAYCTFEPRQIPVALALGFTVVST
jgi:uncharacterized protein